MASTKSFNYFAFGSNLLSKRIHMESPTAVRKGFGYIENYSLDFFHFAARWRGAPATIVENEGYKVWGAIWEIESINLTGLDRQEGVHNQVYKPLTLPVYTSEGGTLECRVYQLVKNPPKADFTEPDRPFERQPSKTYLDVILRGAKETGLPVDYTDFLSTIKHNGHTGDPKFEIDLAVQD
ncbi:gamma-glutamylcyclotransferase-like [Toxorhynchites rutilus septentrionalis]|uniref:gamma-glutamylcyclotransferase-like n=1 Tax=Toxorhynchites rutilus septentrionalis TaxID=329112 RepID=UPI0024794DF2|nr:gamma-glutamylcyclotransferase-like [Toxorhynchites rutilus septentrionalis]